MMSSFNRGPVARQMRRGADGLEQVKRWTLKIEFKKKETHHSPLSPQRNISTLGSVTLHHRDFFPVILSLRHSLPHLFCICPEVTLSIALVYPSPFSCSLPLFVGALMLSLPPSSERTQVSAVTALVRGIMLVIHSQLLAGTPVEVQSCTVRPTVLVCLCVCVCVRKYVFTLLLF